MGPVYDEIVGEHAARPLGAEPLASPDVAGELRNPRCGDEVKVQIALADGVVAAIAMVTTGSCALCRASASVAAQVATGMGPAALEDRARLIVAAVTRGDPAGTPAGALGEAEQALVAVAGRFPTRRQCVSLPWEALSATLQSLKG